MRGLKVSVRSRGDIHTDLLTQGSRSMDGCRGLDGKYRVPCESTDVQLFFGYTTLKKITVVFKIRFFSHDFSSLPEHT
jgi:hypothetical protein